MENMGNKPVKGKIETFVSGIVTLVFVVGFFWAYNHYLMPFRSGSKRSFLPRVSSRDVVQEKTAEFARYHSSMINSIEQEMGDAEAAKELASLSEVPTLFRQDDAHITQFFFRFSQTYSLFEKSVSGIDTSGLPAEVRARFIDIQDQVKRQNEMIKEFESRDLTYRGAFYDSFFVGWDEQEEIYTLKVRQLAQTVRPYGCVLEITDD